MAQTVRDVMTADPIVVQPTDSVAQTAKVMRDADVGAVLVVDDERIHGIVPDRDLVVRGIADGREPGTTPTGAVCSSVVTALSPTDDVGKAVELMRTHGVRALPVVDNDRPVGIVSIGDLAIELDRRSALADISASHPTSEPPGGGVGWRDRPLPHAGKEQPRSTKEHAMETAAWVLLRQGGLEWFDEQR